MSLSFSRRDWLRQVFCGFGYLALAGLADADAARAANNDGSVPSKTLHFPPRAKRVIFASMPGGPSHVDTFDYKPALTRDAGRDVPGLPPGRKLLPSSFKFTVHGKGGPCVSELFPHLNEQADKLSVVNSMWTDLPNHPQATFMLHTGEMQFTRPSLGSWVLYGLGMANENLPGFVTIMPGGDGPARTYSSAFLPAIYQGTPIHQITTGEPVPNLRSPHLTRDLQRQQLDVVQGMNRDLLAKRQANAELEGVIESYELAFRMQDALPGALDLGAETKATHDLYGIGNTATDSIGRQCLMARRLAEAGVRFIQITKGGWDHHRNLPPGLRANCTAIDRPLAGLLEDLDRRGLLDETLVVWGGEFGRTPYAQDGDGRDHNAAAYTMWLAGGGVKRGFRYGSSGEHGIKAVENKVHPHDLHATMLRLMGLDHEKLSYRFGGRNYKLTGVEGARVVEDVFA